MTEEEQLEELRRGIARVQKSTTAVRLRTLRLSLVHMGTSLVVAASFTVVWGYDVLAGLLPGILIGAALSNYMASRRPFAEEMGTVRAVGIAYTDGTIRTVSTGGTASTNGIDSTDSTDLH